MTKGERERAIGCWYGQLTGDALGSLVDGQTPAEIKAAYPAGVRELHDGGTFDTLAGQPTDGSELALALSWSLLDEGDYVEESAAAHYLRWYESEPFGVSAGIEAAAKAGQRANENDEAVAPAMRGAADATSLLSGPLMRVSPIAIFGTRRGDEWVARAAMQDAALTHPGVQQANAVFAVTLARAIRGETDPRALLALAQEYAASVNADPRVQAALRNAEQGPADLARGQGGVCAGLQNAFYVLVHGASLEAALMETVGHGGDSRANAILAGALLGAVHGMHAVPARWRECVDGCEPDEDEDGVMRPRPSWLWPTGAEGLAISLLSSGEDGGDAHEAGGDSEDDDLDDLDDEDDLDD